MLRSTLPVLSCRLPRSIACITLATTLLTTGLATGFASIAAAQQYIPPSRGLPGRREGGGTRGGCVAHQPSLTALTPPTNYGLTTRSHPSWFWYVPQTTAQSAEFVLLDQNENEVYTQTIEITGDAGIIQLTLPAPDASDTATSDTATSDIAASTSATLKPETSAPEALKPDASAPATSDLATTAGLEVGQDYHWYFALICDAVDRSGDVITEGWIQRIEPDAAFTTQLAETETSQHPALYAGAGIWYDAIDAVVDLRQAEPDRDAFQTQWQNLLDSVELKPLSSAPFLF